MVQLHASVPGQRMTRRVWAFVLVALGTMGTQTPANAEPAYFWYRTLGVDDYESRCPSCDPPPANLYVGDCHSDFDDAVDGVDMSGVDVWDWSYDNDIDPPDVEGSYAQVNDYDFALVHVHGGPPDCNADLSPMWLGDSFPDQSELELGSGWQYLKWLWAVSCSWFDVRWQHLNIRPIGTSGTIDCSDGVAGSGVIQRFFDSTWGESSPSYLADGVTVNHTSLTGCGTGDRYKRVRFFPWQNETFRNFCRSDNVLVMMVSAPGSATKKGEIAVRMGGLPRADDDTWDADETVTTVDIYGSSGSPQEYRVRLQRSSADAQLDDFPGLDAYDLYLYFANCTEDLTVHDLWFYYYPLDDDGVQDTMQVRVDCYGQIMQGIHAIMGYSNVVTASGTQDNFDDFMDNWVENEMSTATAFLSQPMQTIGVTGNQICYTAPAIAVPVGPGGNTYKYLFETWESCTDDAAPTGSCFIAWCIPHFSDGYYWTE